MGCAWHATTGTLDAGIDGLIELRDPATANALNLWIPVQIKARTDFQNESIDSFDFTCDARDIDYWLEGNAPVVLIICRPETKEAYWVVVNDYFDTPEKRQTKKVTFRKSSDKFDKNCLNQLLSKAIPRDSGIYMSPLPKQELLFSNLLAIDYISPNIFVADALVSTPEEVWRILTNVGGHYGPEWILKGKKLWSFWDLSEFPWTELIDTGTLDEIETSEWVESDPDITHRDFVQLLNNTLKGIIGKRLRYYKQHKYYYFPSNNKDQLKRRYKIGQRESALTVYQVYRYYKNQSEKSYSRHMAFSPQFIELEGKWYLEITPTYHFSWNGRPDRFYEEKLSKIKQIERHPRVLAQVLLWADFLKEQPNFLDINRGFLRFGDLLSLEAPVGIDDNSWIPQEDSEEAKELSNQVEQLPLFGGDSAS
jgi:hypothetical protein